MASIIEYLTMAALGSLYGVRKLPDYVDQEGTPRMLRFATIPISAQFERWVLFLESLPTLTLRQEIYPLEEDPPEAM